jgi:hypothetical protein
MSKVRPDEPDPGAPVLAYPGQGLRERCVDACHISGARDDDAGLIREISHVLLHVGGGGPAAGWPVGQ